MDIEIDKNLLDTVGCISVPNLDEDIPERVTKKEFKEALENYAQADKAWKRLLCKEIPFKKRGCRRPAIQTGPDDSPQQWILFLSK